VDRLWLTGYVIDFDHDGYPSRCGIDACRGDMQASGQVLCDYTVALEFA